ncbi:MAG: hypothetical protein MI922_16325 [Bacteroidales bacterium]|nr:hypothetical protein [Bacteroidales bacterium]
MITIRPFAGLANRIRAINAACCLAEDKNVELKLLWNQTRECNVKLSNLFSISDTLNVKEIQSAYQDDGRVDHQLRKLCKMLNIKRYKGYDSVLYHADVKKLMNEDKDFNSIDFSKNILINTSERFYNGSLKKDLFTPQKRIKDIVDGIVFDFEKIPTYGLHIRRTDNALAIAKSPLHLFHDKIKLHLEENSDTHFFLATDSLQVEEELINEYGSNITVYQKNSLSRADDNAIQDALVDILCLSKTKKIYGSFWSSFSLAAAEFGGVELETMSVDN